MRLNPEGYAAAERPYKPRLRPSAARAPVIVVKLRKRVTRPLCSVQTWKGAAK